MTSKRVLLMYDSELFLDLIGEALGRAGFAVTVARDLGELGEHPAAADLVLLDVQMPEAFGDDLGMVLRHVRGTAAAWRESITDSPVASRQGRSESVDPGTFVPLVPGRTWNGVPMPTGSREQRRPRSHESKTCRGAKDL